MLKQCWPALCWHRIYCEIHVDSVTRFENSENTLSIYSLNILCRQFSADQHFPNIRWLMQSKLSDRVFNITHLFRMTLQVYLNFEGNKWTIKNWLNTCTKLSKNNCFILIYIRPCYKHTSTIFFFDVNVLIAFFHHSLKWWTNSCSVHIKSITLMRVGA